MGLQIDDSATDWLDVSPIYDVDVSSIGLPKGISANAMLYVLHCATDFSFSENKTNLLRCSRPVLNISSQDDPYVEPELFEEIEDLVPNCERLSFEKGGHNPQRTHAEVVAQKVRDWWLRNANQRKIETPTQTLRSDLQKRVDLDEARSFQDLIPPATRREAYPALCTSSPNHASRSFR